MRLNGHYFKVFVKLSILIPVHDPHALYEGYLLELLGSLIIQTKLPDEVVVAANHDIVYFEALSACVKGFFPIKFFLTTAQSAAENINLGMLCVTGEITKLIFQDDYLAGSDVLEKVVSTLESGREKWLISDCLHLVEETSSIGSYHSAQVKSSIREGKNSVGAPSVVAFATHAYVQMQTQLKYVFDCEWYLSMWHRWGKPARSNSADVIIRLHGGQATHWAKGLLKFEVLEMKRIHPRTIIRNVRCACTLTDPSLSNFTPSN